MLKGKNKRRLITVVSTGIMGLGVGIALMQSVPVYADDVPESIDVQKRPDSSKDYTYSEGSRTTASSGDGVHFINTIKDTNNQSLFCVQWSKAAPSNTRIAAKVQAQPAVTWLVNNYAKGSGKRFETLGKGDEGDYWLYQAVIHWITEPNDVDGPDGYNIQHYFGKAGLASSVESKLKALHDEALKQAKEGTTEEVLNSHAMAFDPNSLNLGSGDLKGDQYSKGFTFTSTAMKNVKVWLDGQPSGSKLSGSGVDLNHVKNGDKLNLSIPYKDLATDKKTFHVKAKGDWEKQIRVAYIYGDTKNDIQNVAKQVVKATTVPLDVTANMDVSASPATGEITFVKKGSADNNSQLLPGTKFKLTGGSVVQEATAGSDGKVEFKSLPLGLVYKIEEIAQPNKYYATDLSEYITTVTALSGSNPSTSATAFGGTLINKLKYHDLLLQKSNVKSEAVSGAQFTIVQVNKGAVFKVDNLKSIKAQAMHREGNEIVSGDNKGNPVIITGNSNGQAIFSMVRTDSEKYDYYGVEVKAPQGYQLSAVPIKMAVDEKGPLVSKETVKDDLKPTLPNTGSERTTQLVIGALVTSAIGASGVGVSRYLRRKHD